MLALQDFDIARSLTGIPEQGAGNRGQETIRLDPVLLHALSRLLQSEAKPR